MDKLRRISSKPTQEDFMTIIRLRDERIKVLEAQIVVYGQAIVLCDSSDPDNPIMDGKLYKAAMKLLEPKQSCKHIYRNVTGQPWLKCMNCGEVIDE